MSRKPTVNSGGYPPAKHPGGRPPKTIDWILFEKLCGIQCTKVEICSMLNISEDALHYKAEKHYKDSFSGIYKRFSESGKCSIRRFQFSHMPKNPAMCMYLGKVYLGQKDTPDNTTPPNDQANDLLRSYQQKLAEVIEENERLKSNIDVKQAASEHPASNSTV